MVFNGNPTNMYQTSCEILREKSYKQTADDILEGRSLILNETLCPCLFRCMVLSSVHKAEIVKPSVS